MLYLTQISKDLAKARGATHGSDRWNDIFMSAVRMALREINTETQLEATIVSAEDEDTELEQTHEHHVSTVIEYYLDARNEYAVDPKRDSFALKNRAIIKLRRLYYADNPPNGMMGDEPA